MDVADNSEEYLELSLAEALSDRRSEPPKQGTGSCWFCHSPVSDNRRWCNAECRDAWEAEQ